MATTTVDGVRIGYELIGESGQPWVITPGGRYTKEDPGLKELALELAADGNRVLLWDRPNCGESDVVFDGNTEGEMHAYYLAGVLRELDLAPAVVMGGSAGARVSLIAAAKYPDVVKGLAVLWISGGAFGLMTLANFYCAPYLQKAWAQGMEAVADMPGWADTIAKNPRNRDLIVGQDRDKFIETMERWMLAYVPKDGEQVPGLPDSLAATITAPTLVFRSGASDAYHTRATSEHIHSLIPNSRMVEPPWPDTEWNDGTERRAHGNQKGAFERWPLLAPQLLEWAKEAL